MGRKKSPPLPPQKRYNMKKTILLCGLAVMMCACSGAKHHTKSSDVVLGREKSKSLEGERVMVEHYRQTGYTNYEGLNEEGTKIVKTPYKWFAGIGKADDKQVAIEMANREAYATIAMVLNNAVQSAAERGNVANNGHVEKALTTYWKQVSISLTKACEPFGEATIAYSPATRMYEVTAKVGIRGDRFQDLLNSAGAFRPSDLSGEELEQFIEVNKAIMEAARGN